MTQPMISLPHDPGCEGFATPASMGWVRCRCWEVGFDDDAELHLTYRGSHLSDAEIERVRSAAVLTLQQQGQRFLHARSVARRL